jgi:hypothetical protein
VQIAVVGIAQDKNAYDSAATDGAKKLRDDGGRGGDLELIRPLAEQEGQKHHVTSSTSHPYRSTASRIDRAGAKEERRSSLGASTHSPRGGETIGEARTTATQ